MALRQKKLGTVILCSLTFLVLAGLAVFGDYVFGRITGVNETRQLALLFRSEAAPYAHHALALTPDTDHRYPDAPSRIRRFRTGPLGTVLGPSNPDATSTTILFLGGSTTESNEVLEENRFPAIVESTLTSKKLNVRVLNGGVRGNTTQDSLLSYLARPQFRSARIVVLMHNINDRLWLTRYDDYSTPPSPDGQTSWSGVQEAANHLIFTLWDFISYRSNLLFSLRQRLTHFNPWTGERIFDGVVSEENVDRFKERSLARLTAFSRNLSAFIALVRSQGALPVLMTQPLGFESEAQMAFNQEIRKFAAENDVQLIDLASHLEGDRGWAFLGDGIHLNDGGSRTIGAIISQQISPLLGTAIETNKTEKGTTDVYTFLGLCAAPTFSSEARRNIGTARRIVGLPGRYPSFSPSGAWMVFQTRAKGRERLVAYHVAKQKIIQLSPQMTKSNERHPAVLEESPYSLRVIFGRGFNENRSGFERLMIRQWPSMVTKPLINNPELGGAIAAVKNRNILFAGFGRNGPSVVPDLMQLQPGQSSPTNLTNTPFEEWRPTAAPDGTVYYIANPRGNFDLYSLTPGATQSKLVFGSEADEWDPAVSPDGQWLVFATKRSGNWDLVLLNVPSGRATQLTAGIEEDWDPSFHPDGRAIVFARHTGQEPAIFGICPFGETGLDVK